MYLCYKSVFVPRMTLLAQNRLIPAFCNVRQPYGIYRSYDMSVPYRIYTIPYNHTQYWYNTIPYNRV